MFMDPFRRPAPAEENAIIFTPPNTPQGQRCTISPQRASQNATVCASSSSLGARRSLLGAEGRRWPPHRPSVRCCCPPSPRSWPP